MKAWRTCEEELKRLPSNNQFTHLYCNRFSPILVADGKYFNVASQEHDWVLLWGVDYFTHDIPVMLIAPSESYQAWRKYCSFFRIVNHYPQLVVGDDTANLKMAARAAFPTVKFQTCYNHFKENIRRDLKVRSDKTHQYRDFMGRIESILDSSQKLSDETFNRWLFTLYRDYRHDVVCLSVLTNIEKYKPELLAYRGIPQAPVTSNLIEGMNGHLESRLFALRSFQTVEYAKLWMNAYVLRRRLTKFTDCKGKFKHLNGKTGVEMSKKQEIDLPTLF